MPSSSPTSPPIWFRPSIYNFVKNCRSSEAWYAQLEWRARQYEELIQYIRMRNRLDRSELKKPTALDSSVDDGPLVEMCELWPPYLDEVLRTSRSDFLADEKNNFRAVEVLPIEYFRGASRRELVNKFDGLVNWELGALDKILVLIDLGAPDSKINKQFQDTLKELRSVAPFPISARGPKKSSTPFNDDRWARWRNYQVLAVLDLDFWSQTTSRPRITYEKLFDWIKPKDGIGAKDWGKNARRVAKEALEVVEALGHYCQHME